MPPDTVRKCFRANQGRYLYSSQLDQENFNLSKQSLRVPFLHMELIATEEKERVVDISKRNWGLLS
jgi:hypothetical protein